jgi:hypothetical protein|tara:strand:+ start:518 stop:760 length:243 start_codon:yes stop_codon:yes gene_type:complete
MKQTLLIIATILMVLGIYSLYRMTPTEMDVIFDENTQELLNNDTCIYDLDSIESYDRMVMDSLDKEDTDWTGTTQGDSIN